MLQKAVDDVLTTAMSMAHKMRADQPYDELQKKFLRACNRLNKRKNWNRE
jgi:hypothetical protein